MKVLLKMSALDTEPAAMAPPGMFTPAEAIRIMFIASALLCADANCTLALNCAMPPRLELYCDWKPPRLFCTWSKVSAVPRSVKTTLPPLGVMVRLLIEIVDVATDDA